MCLYRLFSLFPPCMLLEEGTRHTTWRLPSVYPLTLSHLVLSISYIRRTCHSRMLTLDTPPLCSLFECTLLVVLCSPKEPLQHCFARTLHRICIKLIYWIPQLIYVYSTQLLFIVFVSIEKKRYLLILLIFIWKLHLTGMWKIWPDIMIYFYYPTSKQGVRVLLWYCLSVAFC